MGRRAIVIGGSVAGMSAALALENHYDEIIVMDRQKGSSQQSLTRVVPQSPHSHVLLEGGLDTLMTWVPDLRSKLLEGGALELHPEAFHWFNLGVWIDLSQTRVKALSQSRFFLQEQLSKSVYHRLKITKSQDRVEALIHENGCVSGVVSQKHPEGLCADLVVIANGRQSQWRSWLAEHHYPEPQTTQAKIDVHYATQVFDRGDKEPQFYAIYPHVHDYIHRCSVLPIENNQVIATIASFGDSMEQISSVEVFQQSFMSFPRKEAAQYIKDMKPIGDLHHYSYPQTRRFHFEDMASWPDRLLILGDAVASFNPIYGQGMATAILCAKLMDELHSQKTHSLTTVYRKHVRKIMDRSWQAGVIEDFRMPHTQGRKPPFHSFAAWWTEKLMKASAYDPYVAADLMDVIHLKATPTRMMSFATLKSMLLS